MISSLGIKYWDEIFYLLRAILLFKEGLHVRLTLD